MKRIFKVGHTHDRTTDKISRIFVTDAEEGELDTRAMVATFPVTELYDEHSQRGRANTYRDYMNKLEDAKQVAYEQTMLMDIMKK